MEKILKFLDKNIWILVILFSLPSIFALFIQRGYFGVSDDMHVAWLYEMVKVIKDGKLHPSFVPDLSFGFGYPLFNFVFPLPFYIGALFYFLGFSLVDSIKLVFALSLILSSVFIYFLLKSFASKYVALLGALIYLYAPYRATDVYVRGAIGESLAFVFLPLVTLSFVNILDWEKGGDNLRWIGLESLSVAGLILSHNITAYMFLPLVFIFPLLHKNRRGIFYLILSFLGGLLLSSYFWIPAILDSRLVKYDTVFSYFDHFPTIKQLITPYFGYGASVPGPYDGMSFFVGVPQLLILFLGMLVFLFSHKRFSRKEVAIFLWVSILVLVSVFMMNYRSSFLWNAIPFLGYFQFPWRFLSLVVFSSSLFVIALDKLRISKYVCLFLSLLIAVVSSFAYFKPSEYLGRNDWYYINRYIPVPQASSEYKEISEEYLRLPNLAQRRPTEVLPIFWGEGFLVGTIKNPNGLNVKADLLVENKDGVWVNFRKYDFPGWVVTIDGKEVSHLTGEQYGQILFFVPFGAHEVEITFKEIRRNLFLDFVSLLSLVFILVLVFVRKPKNKKFLTK